MYRPPGACMPCYTAAWVPRKSKPGDPNVWGGRLRIIRMGLDNMKVEVLAEKLEVSPKTINRWEKRKWLTATTDPELLARIAKLGGDPDWLDKHEGVPFLDPAHPWNKQYARPPAAPAKPPSAYQAALEAAERASPPLVPRDLAASDVKELHWLLLQALASHARTRASHRRTRRYLLALERKLHGLE